MSSILDMLGQQLGGDTLKRISGTLKTDDQTTGNAIAAALPTLLGALSRNASRPDGAQALHGALAKDHDGSVLDNLGGLLGNPESGPGEGILRHVLGSRRQRVETGLGRSTGLGAGSVSKLMVMLAPVVLGALGKAQRSRNMDPQALAGLLDGERRAMEQKAPQEMGLLGHLLDADQDGDVDLEDIAKRGLGALSGLFGRR